MNTRILDVTELNMQNLTASLEQANEAASAKIDAALVLVDLQRAIDDPSWGVRNHPEAEVRGARLLAAWRAAGRTQLEMPPCTVGASSPARPGANASIEVVVVLPCAPATASVRRPAASAASIWARASTRSPRSRALRPDVTRPGRAAKSRWSSAENVAAGRIRVAVTTNP